MNRTMLTISALVLVSTPAWSFDFTDEAQVVAATPIYETLNEPTQECWNEAATSIYVEPRPTSYVGSVVGGVAGGLIGNQIGAGNGRTAATAAGAAVGALAGDRIDNGSEDRSVLGALIGGVAGGLLGSQIGQGSGQAAAAAVGAVAGALAGDRIDNRQRYVESDPQAHSVQRCKSTENYRQVVTGYTVLYRYNGREAETVLPYKPGPTIRLGIGPVDGGRAR